jgi:hypothetical protein
MFLVIIAQVWVSLPFQFSGRHFLGTMLNAAVVTCFYNDLNQSSHSIQHELTFEYNVALKKEYYSFQT